jgi:catechol 2,3-dioxygenase-like lactoylglutathione lyase family enzyme
MQRLEHANLSVRDAANITRFLQTAFPNFRVRGKGLDDHGRPWCHVGDEDFYVALTTLGSGTVRRPYGSTSGLNHLGWEVDDVETLRQRMETAGFKHNLLITEHPARRHIYYHDPEGNDWEFVEYKTNDPALRNDYGDVA